MKKDTTQRNDWDAIKIDYLQGMSVRDIGKKYGINYSQISRRAKAKRWGEHNEVGKATNSLIDRYFGTIGKMIEEDQEYTKIQQTFGFTIGSQQDIILRREMIKKMILRNTIFDSALKYHDVVDKYADKLLQNIENSTDGLYTKSIGQGGSVTYASYADDIAKVAVPMISEANKLLKEENTQIAIQNNINTDDKKIVINVKAKKKDAD